MSETLKKFEAVFKDPFDWLAQWKEKNGKKIIGCCPMYVPEEIIHAAGILPTTLFEMDDEITKADQHVHRFVCHEVRGIFDLALNNKLDYLDGVVFTEFCLTIRMLGNVWIANYPDMFHCQIFTPSSMIGVSTQDSLRDQFLYFKGKLEDYIGKEITDEDLSNSIAVYNENRRLLKQLYDFRRAYPEALSVKDYEMVVATAMVMPKEEHSVLLKELLDELNAAPKQSTDKPRVILSGLFCELPSPDLLGIIEEAGAVICDDDIYVGRRYFNTLADETCDPIEALIERYINDVPDPNKHNPNLEWDSYLTDLVKDSGAEGIIMYSSQYCEAQLYDVPWLIKSFAASEMPFLPIETNESGATEQIRTRLEAFSEMLLLGREDI